MNFYDTAAVSHGQYSLYGFPTIPNTHPGLVKQFVEYKNIYTITSRKNFLDLVMNSSSPSNTGSIFSCSWLDEKTLIYT